MRNLVIVSVKSWNIAMAVQLQEQLKSTHRITIISEKNALTADNLNRLDPEYVFFPHWSWIIPEEIFSNYECIVFHMTDLPFGRGGSPLQNLIIREIYSTKISAIKVTKDLDAGEIYLKKDLDLSSGNAEELFKTAASIVFTEMIPFIVTNHPIPQRQEGEIVKFQRRKPEESDLLTANPKTIHKVYDFIRMLDAEGYPKAFVSINNIKIHFSQAQFKDGKLIGKFEVIDNAK